MFVFLINQEGLVQFYYNFGRFMAGCSIELAQAGRGRSTDGHADGASLKYLCFNA